MKEYLMVRYKFLFFFIIAMVFSCVDSEKMVFASYNKPKILYSGYKWWNYDIISIDIYGDDLSHITRNSWTDTEPKASPDGTKLIFASDRDGNREIYSLDLAYIGGYYNWNVDNLTNLTNDPYFDGDFSFSPNGNKILYLKYFPENDNYDIFQMDTDGSNKKNISNTPWYEKKPIFSPDGSSIIYQSWKYNNADIFFTYLIEGNQENISKSLGDDLIFEGTPFTPDGQQIVFSSNRDGNSEIYRMDLSGYNQINLTKNENWDSEPQYTVLGDKIVFSSNRDGNSEIYRMDSDGTNVLNLTKNSSRDWNPKIYPDNTKIIFMSDRDGNWEIYSMNLDGSNQVNLSKNPRTDFSFSFLPLPN
tara:strand:- start:392 stop:1471 length:1080 start_codon:yes stop_codon:yes gene_type:complete